MLPILDQPHPDGWDETFTSHTFHEVTNYYPYRALRGRRYKYVRNLYPELTRPLPSDLWASSTWQAVTDGGLEMMG
jgi:N-sulfoglucosamine sulfohydrolase